MGKGMTADIEQASGYVSEWDTYWESPTQDHRQDGCENLFC